MLFLPGQATVVGISAYILSINEVDEKSMTMKFAMYFRQFWKDSRLRSKIPALIGAGMDEKFVTNFSPKELGIWEPDTFCVNCKILDRVSPQMSTAFTRILPDGEVLYSQMYSTN